MNGGTTAGNTWVWSWYDVVSNVSAPTINTYLTNITTDDSWVPTDPAIAVQPEKEQEDEIVALNVPPVTGKTPTEIAIELRTTLRNMLMKPTGATPSVEKYLTMDASYVTQADESAKAIEAQVEMIKASLAELDKVAALRKPTLIRKEAKQIGLQIEALQLSMNQERLRRGRAREQLKLAVSKLQPAAITANNKAMMTRLYALAQALPTNNGSPQGKLESTVRAIEAILKAHHGVDVLGGFDSVPVPESLPLIMVHYQPTEPEPEPGTIRPYSFLSAAGVQIAPNIVKEALTPTGWVYIHPEDLALMNAKKKNGTYDKLWEEWNDGDCPLEVALDMFRCVRGKYSDETITLVDTTGFVIGIAKRSQKIPVAVALELSPEPAF